MMNTKDCCKRLVAAFIALCMSAVYAGVSVKWIAETSRVQPEIIDAWRGDTLDLACTLRSYGQPVTNGAATASFMWQTNGMGSAWWQTNAVVTTAGVVRATWSPAMDPGAGEVAFFMPVVDADGASYRAAGRIRFRPSPGAGAEFVDLPAPGATLDFGAYTLVNAPWATLEAVNSAIAANNAIIDSAIAGATGALVIPPAVDLGPYATTGMVFAAVQTSSNGLANAIQVAFTAASNRTDAVAAQLAAEISSTSNGLWGATRLLVANVYADANRYAVAVASNAQATAIAAIPSLAGYATEQYVGDYFSANYSPPDLSTYASRTYADAAASNAQATAIAAIPSLAGYATQSWTAQYFATNYTPPDLSSYASRSYADAAASNAQATAIAAIPSLAGYATQEWAADYFATNYTPPDLSSYASRSYADAAASNAQRAAIAAIPSLTGYATQEWAADYFATNYTPPDLSSYASRSYADAAASNAQATAIAAIPSLAGYATETYAQNAAGAAASDALSAAQSYALGLSWATSVGNTRLVSVDGTIWQDATGTVWQVSVTSYGWVGTVVNIATATASQVVFNYVPAVLGVSDEYYTDGTGNELHFEEGMSDTWLLSTNQVGTVFSPLEDPPPGRDATNLTYNTGVELFSLIYRPVALATNAIDHVLYESSGGGGEPGNYAAVSNAAMSAAAQTNDFLRLTGGTMQGDIDMGGQHGDAGTEPADSAFIRFQEYRLGYGELGAGFGIYRYDAGMEATYLFNGDGWEAEFGDDADVMTRADLADALGSYDPPIAEFGFYAGDVTNVALAVVSQFSPTPSAPETTAALRWRADGTACVVSIAAGGTLTASTNNWVEGQAVLATITLASGAGVASNIELVGYSAWPTGTAFVACCYRIGQKVYVVPSTTL